MDDQLRQSLRRYIEDRCVPEPMSGCWIWLLSLASHGYGNASKPGARVVLAHRLSYEVFVGRIPVGMLIQHSCDSKWCVNPAHLSVGTDASNALDKIRKGRAARGAKISRRLPDSSIIEIRQRVAAGAKQTDLAVEFGVDLSTVSKIALYKRHRNVVQPSPANDAGTAESKESA